MKIENIITKQFIGLNEDVYNDLINHLKQTNPGISDENIGRALRRIRSGSGLRTNDEDGGMTVKLKIDGKDTHLGLPDDMAALGRKELSSQVKTAGKGGRWKEVKKGSDTSPEYAAAQVDAEVSRTDAEGSGTGPTGVPAGGWDTGADDTRDEYSGAGDEMDATAGSANQDTSDIGGAGSQVGTIMRPQSPDGTEVANLATPVPGDEVDATAGDAELATLRTNAGILPNTAPPGTAVAQKQELPNTAPPGTAVAAAGPNTPPPGTAVAAAGPNTPPPGTGTQVVAKPKASNLPNTPPPGTGGIAAGIGASKARPVDPNAMKNKAAFMTAQNKKPAPTPAPKQTGRENSGMSTTGTPKKGNDMPQQSTILKGTPGTTPDRGDFNPAAAPKPKVDTAKQDVAARNRKAQADQEKREMNANR